jgi:molybdopterin-guanine dinucleotide biosynthesis protein A
MGQDKALLDWQGRPLLAHAVALARSAGSKDVFISGAPERYGGFGAECIADIYPGAGPLGGIATVLEHVSHARVLMMACDLPLIPAGFLSWLWLQSVEFNGWSVPESAPGQIEPLCAVYTKALLAPIHQSIEQREFKIDHALRGAPTRILSSELLRSNSFGDEIFRNLNRPEDYNRALTQGRRGD